MFATLFSIPFAFVFFRFDIFWPSKSPSFQVERFSSLSFSIEVLHGLWFGYKVVLLASHFPPPRTRLYAAPHLPAPHTPLGAEILLQWQGAAPCGSCGALLCHPGGKAHELPQLPPELGRRQDLGNWRAGSTCCS